jgi:hypothetical protein
VVRARNFVDGCDEYWIARRVVRNASHRYGFVSGAGGVAQRTDDDEHE